jgi:hypothetical protein
MGKSVILLLVLVSGTGVDSGFGQTSYKKLDNPDASPEAVALYKYLQDMVGKKILSGRMWAPWGIDEEEYILKTTGKLPAVKGVDFIHEKDNQDEVRREQMEPMVGIIKKQSGKKPKELLADSGYCSEQNLKYLEKKKIDGYVATHRQKHGQPRETCKRGPLPRGSTRVERMNRKLQTRAGANIYAARKSIVEPVFGQIKHARGYRRFLMRGIEKVKAEWALVCATHNILKMYRLIYS